MDDSYLQFLRPAGAGTAFGFLARYSRFSPDPDSLQGWRDEDGT